VARSGDAREHAVEPSPTREELVFVRERDGATDLFVADLGGENERQLTDSPDRAERLPVWSPDGDRIAYVDGRAPQLRIVVIDRQGAVLFETPGDQPGWAPPFQD
jgi:Tol biopolymer transport system component